MSGGWPNYFRPLVSDASWTFGFVAVIYISLVVFAVIRVISAIFLKQTLQVASKDADMQASESRAKTKENSKKLLGVFQSLDADNTGQLSREEFMQVTAHPDVMALMASFELATHDVKGLFDLLDNGHGVITYNEFIDGVMHLKGQARSLDVVAITRNTERMQKVLNQLLQRSSLLEGAVMQSITAQRMPTSIPPKDNSQEAEERKIRQI
jgi:hypothetical protein